MRRREFTLLLMGTAQGWPLIARAQQPAMSVIGFLHPGSPAEIPAHIAGFHRGLGEAGYVEGRNVVIEYRWAEGHYDRLPALAADLVRLKVAVIAANGGSASALAAKGATRTIPIVFGSSGDPVKGGLVSNLKHPGGNITGAAMFGFDLGPKRLELLRQLVPQAAMLGVLVNPTGTTAVPFSQGVREAARAAGMQSQLLSASNDTELEAVFATIDAGRIDSLIVNADVYFFDRMDRLITFAARHKIPTSFDTREYADAGGLMSYSNSLPERYRQVGLYIGKILDGARPGDLPVVQPTKFELIINLKTAKALGLTIPQSILAGADEVIE